MSDERDLDAKCRAKEKEWREALMEKRDALLADRDRLTKQCEDLTAGKERALRDGRIAREENARMARQRDVLVQELRRARTVLKTITAENERLEHCVERHEYELKTESEAHQREKNNFQEISQSLTKEIESLNAAHMSAMQDVTRENELKLAKLSQDKEKMRSDLEENIMKLSDKIEFQLEENKKLASQINGMHEELNSLRCEHFALKATIEKQARVIRDERLKAEEIVESLNQRFRDSITENKSIKEENYESCAKMLALEQKLQSLISENMNLKCIQTDNSYKREILDKKLDDMNFERQKLMTELECIKNHPVLVEMEHIKQQNDILRKVILEQKQIILKFSSQKDLDKQATMTTAETQTVNHMSAQTDRKIKDIKKHCCIQRNIDAVKRVSEQDHKSSQLNEDEKRMQDLENIVYILKHTLIEKVKSEFIGEIKS